MKLYVVRHGESENNEKKCWTGWQDPHLTDKGRTDAEGARRILEGVSFDHVISSDLCRAVETAEIVVPGCTPETTPLLREINVGSLGGQPLSLPTDPEARKKMSSEGYTDYGGESREDLRNRAREFLAMMAKEENKERVAAFCHAGFLRAVLDEVLTVKLSGKHIRCYNCAIGIFEYADGVWALSSWINPIS